MAGSTSYQPEPAPTAGSHSAEATGSLPDRQAGRRDPLAEARRRATEWKPLLEMTGALVTLLVPIFCVRVLVLARFDPDVATALVTNSSPSTMGLSILVLVFPFLGILVAMWVCYVAGSRARGAGKRALLPSAAAIFVACCCAFPLAVNSARSGAVIVIPALFFTLLITFMSARAAAGSFWDYSPYIRIVVVMSAVTALVLVVAGKGAAAMWLPPERASVNGQLQTIYVLRADEADMVLYLPSLSAVRREATANVKNRQFCRDADQSKTLAASMFGGPKGLPDCP